MDGSTEGEQKGLQGAGGLPIQAVSDGLGTNAPHQASKARNTAAEENDTGDAQRSLPSGRALQSDSNPAHNTAEFGEIEEEQQSLLPSSALQTEGGPAGDGPGSELQTQQSHKAQHCLYGAQIVSAWGARMFEFAIGLSMLELGSGSLLLVSAFGLLKGVAVVLAGSLVGRYIDRTDRLKAASLMYALENGAGCLSASAVLLALSYPDKTPLFWGCTGLAVGLGAVGSVGAMGGNLSIEREWTKALCSRDSARLANLNAGMRRIDLICIILPPIMVGFAMTYTGIRMAVFLVMAWNAVAWAPQILLIRLAHDIAPALRVPKQGPEGSAGLGLSSKPSPTPGFWTAWGQYCRQSVMPAALSLALLHLTVLSFGLITTAYLKWRGLSEIELAVYRGLGAVLGVSATYLFPPMHAKLGLTKSGSIAIWAQLACLTVGVVPTVLMTTSHLVGTRMLTGALVASRLGLWLFDLCVSQMLQDWVPLDQLGAVNGVQGSLASFFSSASYLAGLISPDPEKFSRLTAASWAVVFTSALLYSIWASSSSNREKSVPPSTEVDVV